MTFTPVGAGLSTGAATDRVQFVDGLRGVAITLVVLFHVFARWPDVVPYGDAYSGFLPFKYGFAGVQLFFVISGFVIFMTLERTADFPSFIWRRWLRLFPAMLACSLLIFVTAPVFLERPAGAPHPIDLLPGILFADPYFWNRLGVGAHSLEGSFWSLYIEMAFYLIVSLAYFAKRRLGACLVVAGCWAISLLAAATASLEAGDALWPVAHLATQLTHALRLDQFVWFLLGMLCYLCKDRLGIGAFLALAAIALAGALQSASWPWDATVFTFCVTMIFPVCLCWPAAARLASIRPLTFIGFISYPLYLLHENMVVSATVKAGAYLPKELLILAPVLPILFVGLLAYLMAAYVEPRIRAALRQIPAVLAFRQAPRPD